jgi:hypothetical protein
MAYDSPQLAREKRTSPRIPVSLPVLIEVSGSQHNAKVHNLSRGGALVEVTGQMPSGSHIRFNCGSIETTGTVVWKDQSCLGVKFGAYLDDERLSQQVARSEAAARHRELFKRPREA